MPKVRTTHFLFTVHTHTHTLSGWFSVKVTVRCYWHPEVWSSLIVAFQVRHTGTISAFSCRIKWHLMLDGCRKVFLTRAKIKNERDESCLCVIKWTFIDFHVTRNASWFIHIAGFCMSPPTPLSPSLCLSFSRCWTGATLTSDNGALSLSFSCTVGCLLLPFAIWKKGCGRKKEKK